ncbi:MAG: hypothetical protein Q9226_004330 [Calogaya cf. arnoldii]
MFPLGKNKVKAYIAPREQWKARFTRSIPAQSASPVSLPLQQISDNCYLELRRDASNFYPSPIFSVTSNNGTSTTWSSGSQSNGQGSPIVASAIEQATATPERPSLSAPRPDLRLPDDGGEEQYVLNGGTSCLDVNNTLLKHRECWEILKLSRWLPEWTGIQQFFATWLKELTTAIEQSSSYIGPIIKLIDEPERDKSGIFLDVFLTVLGVGLSFIPVVGPAAALGITGLGLVLINGAIAGVKQVPAIAQKIWPSGTEDTIPLQIDALEILFQNTLSVNLRQNFDDTLGIIQGLGQGNTSAFLAFADQGVFALSPQDSPIAKAFDDDTQKLLRQSMTTFLVSEALAQNGWQALILPGVDGEGINNGDQACPQWADPECNASKDVGCSGHDEFGQCLDYYWWYSVEQKSMYTLIGDNQTDDKAIGYLQTMFRSGWTTGKLLFENAAKCQFQFMLGLLKPQLYNYTLTGGQAGFLYPLSIPEVAEYEEQQSSGIFLPIPGSAFVALSKLAKVNENQFHPLSNPFRFDPERLDTGIDPSCASNLNVSIANSWKTKNWVGNNP